MPEWTSRADWMAFSHLDDGMGVTQAFTIAYKITDESTELWTARFGRFKAKDLPALAGALGVMRANLPKLLGALNLRPDRTLFIPAISSGEMTALANGHVSILARLSASSVGAQYSLSAVSKNKHKPIHSVYNASDRTSILNSAAYVGSKVSCKNVFVFDDFITRGGTMSRIAQSLIAANPGLTVYGVALGKTERKSFWGQLDNVHVTPALDGLWRAGEQRYHAKKSGATA